MIGYPGERVLLDFISGRCRDEERLVSIEAELDDHFRDDDVVHDFVVDIARYSRSGGGYFIGEGEMLLKIKRIVKYLDERAARR